MPLGDPASPSDSRVDRIPRPPDGIMLAVLLETASRQGVEASFVVGGSSMFPCIRDGDVVHVRPVGRNGGGAKCGLGDVVAVRRGSMGGLMVHRVIARRGQEIVLRGDNTPFVDGTFSIDAVLGVVTKVERRGRSVWFGAGPTGALVAMLVRTGTTLALVRLLHKVRSRWSRLRRGSRPALKP